MIKIKTVSYPDDQTKDWYYTHPLLSTTELVWRASHMILYNKIWPIRTPWVRIWHTSTIIIRQFPLPAPERDLKWVEIMINISVRLILSPRGKKTMLFRTNQDESWTALYYSRGKLSPSAFDLSWTQTEIWGSLRRRGVYIQFVRYDDLFGGLTPH